MCIFIHVSMQVILYAEVLYFKQIGFVFQYLYYIGTLPQRLKNQVLQSYRIVVDLVLLLGGHLNSVSAEKIGIHNTIGRK
jgi:hypothetical protein